MNSEDKLYRFRGMPFGYQETKRILILIKVIWTEGIPSYIQINNGVCFKVAAMKVKSDLEKLGLINSPDKCECELLQRFTWCGFDWNLILSQ